MTNKRYPVLGEKLIKQLADVPQTDGLYFPCMVTLSDGRDVDCVYLAEASPWYVSWGVWPEDDRGKYSVSASEIVSLRNSPSRLPHHIAEKIYQHGESGMGYTLFTLIFIDGTKQNYESGNAIDFVTYPEGQSANTVVDMIPHAGRDDPHRLIAPSYFWCLFEYPRR